LRFPGVLKGDFTAKALRKRRWEKLKFGKRKAEMKRRISEAGGRSFGGKGRGKAEIGKAES
jgi:hypothetical protein